MIETHSIVTDVTYTELKALQDAEELEPGLSYKITDFATVHYYFTPYAQVDVINTGATEPIVVTASSANTLEKFAWSPSHPEDIIEYDWNPANWEDDIAFWKDGAIITGWKGAIIRRVDTIRKLGAPCDIRNWKSIKYEASIPEHDLVTNFTGVVHVYEASTNDIYRSLVPTGNQNHALSDVDWWCRVVIWGTDNPLPNGWTGDALPLCHDTNGIGWGLSAGALVILPGTSTAQYLPIFEDDCKNITVNSITSGETASQTPSRMPNIAFINSKNVYVNKYAQGAIIVNSGLNYSVNLNEIGDSAIINTNNTKIDLTGGVFIGSSSEGISIGVAILLALGENNEAIYCTTANGFIGHDNKRLYGNLNVFMGSYCSDNNFVRQLSFLAGEMHILPNYFKHNTVKIKDEIGSVTSSKATSTFTSTIEKDEDGDIVIWNIDTTGSVDSEDL